MAPILDSDFRLLAVVGGGIGFKTMPFFLLSIVNMLDDAACSGRMVLWIRFVLAEEDKEIEFSSPL